MQFYSIYIESYHDKPETCLSEHKHEYCPCSCGQYAKLHLEITLDMISQMENMAVGEDQHLQEIEKLWGSHPSNKVLASTAILNR